MKTLRDLITNVNSWLHQAVPLFTELRIANPGIVVGDDAFGQFVSLDLDSDTYIGKLVIWKTGLCGIEILRVSDGATVTDQMWEFETWPEIVSKLNECVGIMRPDTGR